MIKKTVRIHVSPVKRFYAEMLGDQEHVAAILCSTNPVDMDKLKGIRYIHEPFADVVDHKRNDAFCEEKAMEIKDFLEGLVNITELYVCCDSGESRSAAVTAAILRFLGRDEMTVWKNIHYHPNPLVYRLQCEAFGCPCTKLRAALLYRYNKWLFQRQIQRQRR